MCADDTNISTKSTNTLVLEKPMNSELTNLKMWLEANRLSVNITKTEIMIIGSRQRLSTIDNYDLKVGVYIDQTRTLNHWV